MNNFLYKIRILDEQGRLSITNILLIGFTFKLLFLHVDPLTSIGFVTALLQYAHKRHITKPIEKEKEDTIAIEELNQRITELEGKVTDATVKKMFRS